MFRQTPSPYSSRLLKNHLSSSPDLDLDQTHPVCVLSPNASPAPRQIYTDNPLPEIYHKVHKRTLLLVDDISLRSDCPFDILGLCVCFPCRESECSIPTRLVYRQGFGHRIWGSDGFQKGGKNH